MNNESFRRGQSNMKRQRGRGRGKPGGNHGNQGNRSFESNGPEVKIRGNAATIYEKYMQLARDATSSGDRVRAENLQQHAEHYFRILQLTQPQRRDNSNSNDDDNDDNSNDDSDDSSGRNDNRNQGRGRGRQDNNRSRNTHRDDAGNRDDDDRDGNQDDDQQPSGKSDRDTGESKPKRAPRQPRRQAAPQRDPLEVVNPEGEQPTIAARDDGGEEQPKPKARRGRKPKVADDSADAAQQALDTASKKADSRKSTSDEAA